jgi:hypothetical protein
MAGLKREADNHRAALRQSSAAMHAEAARRATKPHVTQAHVDSLMAVLSPEGRAAVALQAVHRLRVAPSLLWTKW